MPVQVMKSVMTKNEYNGWIKYLNNKPPDISEIQLAVLSTLVSNGLGGKSKVDDFILSKQQKNNTVHKTTAFDSFNLVARDMK